MLFLHNLLSSVSQSLFVCSYKCLYGFYKPLLPFDPPTQVDRCTYMYKQYSLHFVLQVMTYPKSFKCGFVLLHLDPLSTAIHDSARLWVTSLGKYLNESAWAALSQLKEEIDVCVCVGVWVWVCVCGCGCGGC